MDIEKEFEETFKKEANTYRDKAKDDEKKKKKHFAFGGKKDNVRAGGSGYGKGEEVEESKIGTGDQEHNALVATKAKMLMKQALKSGKKQSQDWWNKQVKLAGLGEDIEEGFKDLPPHLQKSLKDFEKKQKKLKKQFPDLKTKTFVYNPETGKPDIEIKEKIMDLEDTVKQIIGETNKKDKSEKVEIEEIELSKEDAASFISAASKAKQDGKKKFKIGGKEYPVTIKVKIPEEKVELKKLNKEKVEKKESKSFSKMFSHIKSLMQGK